MNIQLIPIMYIREKRETAIFQLKNLLKPPVFNIKCQRNISISLQMTTIFITPIICCSLQRIHKMLIYSTFPPDESPINRSALPSRPESISDNCYQQGS